MDKEKDRKQEIDLSMIPPINDLRMELAREEAKYEFRRALLNIAGALTVAAAIAALLLTRFLILLQVNGSSMMPTLADGEIVILRQTKEIEKGDIIGLSGLGNSIANRQKGLIFKNERDKGWVIVEPKRFGEHKE